jgi:penicillin-binding protein 1A
MDNGFTPGSVMNDAPLVIDDVGSGRRWKPVNSDLKFRGPMTLYSALISSRNLISIKILDRIGFETLQQTAEAMGITERLPQSLTIALGAHGLYMPELVTAYSTFANMGVRVRPRYITRIEDRYGRVVEITEPDRFQAVSSGAACAVTWMLRGVIAQGTGTVAKPLDRPVGGKTGTTNDYSDAWFVGFTPELVTAVWMGTDQLRPRAVGEVGGRAVGPIFLYYMQEALKDVPVQDFVVPPDAEIAPGGAFGICYKAGTVGTGLSETITAANPADDFLRGDFEDGLAPPPLTPDYEAEFNNLPGETLGGGGD